MLLFLSHALLPDVYGNVTVLPEQLSEF